MERVVGRGICKGQKNEMGVQKKHRDEVYGSIYSNVTFKKEEKKQSRSPILF